MPLCRDIITRALRKVGAIGLTDAPTSAEIDMGLAALQSMFDGWAAAGMFGPLRDIHVTEAYTAKTGQRIRTTEAVTLPTFDGTDADNCCDDYGFSNCGSDRPQNRRLIVVVNPDTGVRQTNLWDAWLGAWVRIEALKEGDECPLSALGADGLACCLARVIADESSWTVGAQTERQANLFMTRLGGTDGVNAATRAVYC